MKRKLYNLRLPRKLRMSLAGVLGSAKPEASEDPAKEPTKVST